MKDLEEWLESLPRPPVDESWKLRLAQQLRRQERGQKVRRVVLPLLLLTALGVGGRAAWLKIFPHDGIPRRVWQVPVAGPVELDGKSREQVMELREQAWTAVPELSRAWKPAGPMLERPAWMQLKSGRRWVGLEGHLIGSVDTFPQDFHRGDSQASLVLRNPALLLSLESSRVSRAFQGSPELLEAATREQVPQSIQLDGLKRRLEVVYRIPAFAPLRLEMTVDQPTHFVNSVNAGEAGFQHFSIDQAGCQNVDITDPQRLRACTQLYAALPVQHGVEKINNVLPRTASFCVFRARRLPAQLTFRLWRKAPEQPESDPPDWVEVIRLESGD